MKNVISLFAKNLVNVAMRTAEAFYNIFMYLYNKNILKYGQIARNGMESMIPDTEGRSNGYAVCIIHYKLDGYSFLFLFMATCCYPPKSQVRCIILGSIHKLS